MENLKRLEMFFLVTLLITLVFLGFMIGAMVTSKVVAAENKAENPWVAFYKAHPEFPATDANCARLEEKAIQIESLMAAYAEFKEER